MEYWERPYNIIRVLNELLERLPNAQVSEEFRKQRMAEVRFLRAFNYFAMVKRYGGVPLITKVQSKNDPESELRPARNKEQEIYDFIISEAKVASKDLPQVVSDVPGCMQHWHWLHVQPFMPVVLRSMEPFSSMVLSV